MAKTSNSGVEENENVPDGKKRIKVIGLEKKYTASTVVRDSKKKLAVSRVWFGSSSATCLLPKNMLYKVNPPGS